MKRFRVDVPKIRSLLKPGWQGVDIRRELSKAYRIPAVPGGLAHSPQEAGEIADRVGYPVVMKMSVPDISHKTDVGGVLLDVPDAPSVWKSFDRLLHKDAEGVNVQKMLSGGREVVLGFTSHAAYGPVLMFGLGGIFVEVMKDVTFHLAPITAEEAMQMLAGTKSFALLEGARGRAAADLTSIAGGLQRISQLVTDFPQIVEMDINPFIVGEVGTPAVVADARMTLSGDVLKHD